MRRHSASGTENGISAPKLIPASAEKANFTAGSSPAAVNQATTASVPATSMAGPLTGQPGITHPSSWTTTGSVQAPSASRTTEIQRLRI